MIQGTLERHVQDVTCLEGNPLGDPTAREVFVYTPAGCEGATLPAAVALAGFSGSTWSFLNRGWKRASLPERLDAIFAAGAPPMRVVIPDVMTAVGGSQFIDSAGIGAYGTWMTFELRAFIEERYPTSGRWGAFGKSSGGFGAISLALDFPGEWTAIAAHSPDAGFEYGYLPDFPGAAETLRQSGGLTAWWEDFQSRDEMKGSDHAVANLIGMSCAYSPDPDARPLPCQLPVDLETGAVRPEIFREWMFHDPVHRIAVEYESLRRLEGIWLDVGTRDEFRLQVGARLAHQVMEAAEISHCYGEHNGGHFKLNSRLSESLPWLAGVLSEE